MPNLMGRFGKRNGNALFLFAGGLLLCLPPLLAQTSNTSDTKKDPVTDMLQLFGGNKVTSDFGMRTEPVTKKGEKHHPGFDTVGVPRSLNEGKVIGIRNEVQVLEEKKEGAVTTVRKLIQLDMESKDGKHLRGLYVEKVRTEIDKDGWKDVEITTEKELTDEDAGGRKFTDKEWNEFDDARNSLRGGGNQEIDRTIQVGEKVSAGQALGDQGATGHVTGPHIHVSLGNGKGIPGTDGHNYLNPHDGNRLGGLVNQDALKRVTESSKNSEDSSPPPPAPNSGGPPHAVLHTPDPELKSIFLPIPDEWNLLKQIEKHFGGKKPGEPKSGEPNADIPWGGSGDGQAGGGQRWDYRDEQNPREFSSGLKDIQKAFDEVYDKVEKAGFGNDIAGFLKNYPTHIETVMGPMFKAFVGYDENYGNGDIPWGTNDPAKLPSWDLYNAEDPQIPPRMAGLQEFFNTIYDGAKAAGYDAGNYEKLIEYLKNSPGKIDQLSPWFQDMAKMAEQMEENEKNGEEVYSPIDTEDPDPDAESESEPEGEPESDAVRHHEGEDHYYWGGDYVYTGGLPGEGEIIPGKFHETDNLVLSREAMENFGWDMDLTKEIGFPQGLYEADGGMVVTDGLVGYFEDMLRIFQDRLNDPENTEDKAHLVDLIGEANERLGHVIQLKERWEATPPDPELGDFDAPDRDNADGNSSEEESGSENDAEKDGEKDPSAGGNPQATAGASGAQSGGSYGIQGVKSGTEAEEGTSKVGSEGKSAIAIERDHHFIPIEKEPDPQPPSPDGDNSGKEKAPPPDDVKDYGPEPGPEEDGQESYGPYAFPDLPCPTCKHVSELSEPDPQPQPIDLDKEMKDADQFDHIYRDPDPIEDQFDDIEDWGDLSSDGLVDDLLNTEEPAPTGDKTPADGEAKKGEGKDADDKSEGDKSKEGDKSGGAQTKGQADALATFLKVGGVQGGGDKNQDPAVKNILGQMGIQGTGQNAVMQHMVEGSSNLNFDGASQEQITAMNQAMASGNFDFSQFNEWNVDPSQFFDSSQYQWDPSSVDISAYIQQAYQNGYYDNSDTCRDCTD